MQIDLTKLRRWEAGDMTSEEEISFFQKIVNSGLAWKLGGKYMRRAGVLLELGLVEKQNVSETA